MNTVLEKIHDRTSAMNIQAMTDSMVKQLKPLKIYLFGSFADGTYTQDSDFDFYIVVKDGTDLWDATAKARKAVRDIKTRPVDVVAGTSSRFNEYGKSQNSLYVEGEVFRKGLLLYDQEKAGELA